MIMNNFQILTKELQTDLVIFIDDDFTPSNSSTEILTYITFLNDKDFPFFKDRLQNLNQNLSTIVEEFRLKIPGDFITSESDKAYIDAGEIVELLDQKQLMALKEDAESICREIDNSPELPELVMNFGQTQFSGGVACYKPFFESLSGDNNKIIRVYKGLEGNKFNEFENEIIQIINKLENKRFLLIVDKQLANNQNGNTIINNLRDRIGETHTFFSVLFTSFANQQPDPPPSHYQFAIQKIDDGQETIKNVSQGLAICAYAVLFDSLTEININALKEARDIVLKSGKENILFLANNARSEGEHVFAVINKWFSLLSQKKISENLFSEAGGKVNYNFIIGLTSLLDAEFFGTEDNPASPEFKDAIEELSSFEIFDRQINLRHAPPSPGDIYAINNNGLYILVGQECDLIIRKNRNDICRNEKIAEMIECTFDNKMLKGKLIETSSTMSLNYFPFDEKIGSLTTNFSKKLFFDFKLLDLCSLNGDGQSRYPTSKKLQDKVSKALPLIWSKYYPTLFKELDDKIKIYKALEDAGLGTSALQLDKSFILEPKNNNDSISFELKRVARLKGKFKEYFLRRYWEYKTRMGLDNISVSNVEKNPVKKLSYGFINDLQTISVEINAWIKLSENRDKNDDKINLPIVFEKNDILERLPEPFKSRFSEIELEEILIKDNYEDKITKIKISKIYDEENNLDSLKLEIRFPFKNQFNNKYIKVKDKINLYDVFPPNLIKDLESNAYCIIEKSEYQLNVVDRTLPPEEQGHRKFSVEEIEKGVFVPQIEKGFQLDRFTGIISEFKAAVKNKNNEEQSK